MKKHRLSVHHILPALSLVFTLFVFAPVDLYLSSAEDLWFSLADIASWLGIMALCAFVIIVLLSWFLPPKLSVAFRAAVYAVSFLLYLQGNLLVLNYGTLNGSEINWSAYTLPYILDALLWIAVIVLFIFLMFRFRKKFRRILEAAACILLITQVISLSVFLVQHYSRKAPDADRFLAVKNEFTVSPESNTVVFVLDTFDSHIFNNLSKKYPDRISEDFENFTFYPDTVGGATRTKYAIPFILTGGTNTEEQSYSDYLSKSFASSPLISELATGNYDSGFYTVSHYIDISRADAIGNSVVGEARPSSAPRLTAHFMKLVAFRYAPSALARFFWMYTGDFEIWKSSAGGNAAYKLDDVSFHKSLTSRRVSASAERPGFRFYHLTGPHAPYTMNEKCQRVSYGESDEETQALGTLAIVSEYLSQLRELGLYDSATVVVMADHGFSAYSSVEQSPLFMVKLAGASHPFETSDLPLSYAAFPEIMVSALRGTLTSLEPFRASSPRYFYLHSEKEGIVNIKEYAIDGPVWKTKPQTTGTVYHENTLHLSRDYKPGTTIYFDERDTARSYLVSGFSKNEAIYTWTTGNDAVMLFELPQRPGDMVLSLRHGTYNGEQTVEVWVNDQLLDTYTAKGTIEHSVLIPAGTVTGTELRLRLHLPDAVSPLELGHSTDKRLLALSMNSLTLRNGSR